MEWVSIDDRLPRYHCIVKVKTWNGDEFKAYFHSDRAIWLCFYGQKTSYFQDMKGNWLHSVKHWMPLPIPLKGE